VEYWPAVGEGVRRDHSRRRGRFIADLAQPDRVSPRPSPPLLRILCRGPRPPHTTATTTLASRTVLPAWAAHQRPPTLQARPRIVTIFLRSQLAFIDLFARVGQYPPRKHGPHSGAGRARDRRRLIEDFGLVPPRRSRVNVSEFVSDVSSCDHRNFAFHHQASLPLNEGLRAQRW